MHEENIASTDRFFVANLKFTIGKIGDAYIAKRATKIFANFLGQVARFCAREDFHFTVHYVVSVYWFGMNWVDEEKVYFSFFVVLEIRVLNEL